MPIKLDDFVKALAPEQTVLLFGAGASMPSGAPAVEKLITRLAETFGIDAGNYSLAELAGICEAKSSRAAVISALRKLFNNLKPAAGLNNLPLYNWKSIFTTNYDTLIEQSYRTHKKTLRTFDSNFDFHGREPADCELFKLHGTIEKDISDGHHSRMILTEADYEETEGYREQLYNRLKGDLAGADLLIIGYSLSDPEIKTIVNRAISIKNNSLSPARICLLMYARDDDRANLLEKRGLEVVFGGVDDFFAALTPRLAASPQKAATASDNLIDSFPALRPVTIDVDHAAQIDADISGMFNGWPATYADVAAGHCFRRTIADGITGYLKSDGSLCAVVLGASGVGKTSAARQVLNALRMEDYRCWEHAGDFTLDSASWMKVAEALRERREAGALLVDDAHHHLHGLGELIDKLVLQDNRHLKIVVCSSRNHWYPRVKTPNIFRHGKDFVISKLQPEEIERLLTLLDSN